MAVQLITVHPKVTYILKCIDESSVALLVANRLTGIVGSAILPTAVCDMLTTRLQTLMSAVPVLADFDAAFAGAVRSLARFRQLEQTPNPLTFAYLEVEFPHSTSSPADEYAQGRAGGGTGLAEVTLTGDTATMSLQPDMFVLPACVLLWTPAVTLPSALSKYDFGAYHLADGRTFVVGGYLGGPGVTDQCNMFSADGSAITAVAPYGALASRPGVIQLGNGEVLAFGGLTFFDLATVSMVFDPTLETWEFSGNPDTMTVHSGLVRSVNGALKVGGIVTYYTTFPATTDVVEEFYATTHTWAPVPSYPHPVANVHLVNLYTGDILAFGGLNGNTNGAYGDAYIFSQTEGTWTPAANMNVARFDAGFVVLPDGRVLVAGGVSSLGGPALASAEIYDPEANTWTLVSPMPAAKFGVQPRQTGHLEGGGMVLMSDNRAYYPAGSTGGVTAVDTVYVYYYVSDTWTVAPATLSPRKQGGVAVLGACNLFLFGGTDGADAGVLDTEKSA